MFLHTTPSHHHICIAPLHYNVTLHDGTYGNTVYVSVLPLTQAHLIGLALYMY